MKIIGIALMVAGVGVIFWAYQMSNSIGSQLSEVISGSASDQVMIRYIGGGISLAVGLFLFFKK